MSVPKSKGRSLEIENIPSAGSTIRGSRFTHIFRLASGEPKRAKTVRKRDRFKSFLSYYLPQVSASSTSSDSATLVPSECKEDKKYVKLSHVSTAEHLVAKENENTSAESTIDKKAISRRHTLFHRLRKSKPTTNYLPDDSIRTTFSFANSIQLARKKHSPYIRQDEKHSGKSSLRQKIRSRLALKAKPTGLEPENELFISSDIVSTIKDCVLNDNSVTSNVDRESTFDLDLDVERTDSTLSASVDDQKKFDLGYSQVYNVGVPPRELPTDQHPKWQRRQLLKQTANSFDHEKWKSRQSLLLQENNGEKCNFSPLNSNNEDLKSSPIRIFENVSKFFNSASNLKENQDTSFSTAKDSDFKFGLKSTMTPSSIDPNCLTTRKRSQSINSFNKSAQANNLRRVFTVGDSQLSGVAWSANSDSQNEKDLSNCNAIRKRDSTEKPNSSDIRF